MGLNVGILGLGNMGNQCAALANTLKGIPALGVNSSERDIDAVKSKTQIDVLYFGDGKGAGLDRNIGKQYVKDQIASFIGDDRFKTFVDGVDYVFVVNSAGGGTGGSFGPIITEILSKFYMSKGIKKYFINIGVLPSIGESIGNQRNTLEYLKEMTDLGLSYMLFDNNNAKGKSTNEMFESVNRQIVETISVFRGDYCKLSPYGMLDEMDMHKILTCPGMIFVNILDGIYQEKINTDGSIEELLVENINKNNLMVNIDRDKIVKRRAYITNLSTDLHEYFNRDLPKITELYGEPIEMFTHFSVNEDQDERANFLVLILSGLSLPENRLKNIISRIDAVEEALKKKKESSLLGSALGKVEQYNSSNNSYGAGNGGDFDLSSIINKY